MSEIAQEEPEAPVAEVGGEVAVDHEVIEFGAITIDTQVFDSNSYDFNGGWLAQLKQFRGGDIRFVISELVIREGLRHLRDRIVQTRDHLEKSHKKGVLYGLLAKDDVPTVKTIDPVAQAKGMMDRFIEETGAQVIPLEGVSSAKLIDMYEQGIPPFAAKGKKHEFPDAIALLTLGQWADAQGRNLLAVSNDDDWQGFKHGRVRIVRDLDTALPKFQTGIEATIRLFRSALRQMRDARTPLGAAFEQLLADAVAEHEVEGEANSSVMAEQEGGSATLKSFTFPEDEDDYSIVQAGSEAIVVQVSLDIVVDATGDFSMSIFDSIDRDYVPMGTASAMAVDAEVSTEVLITLATDPENGGYDIEAVEIVGGPFYVDFGTVEIDFGDPDEERW